MIGKTASGFSNPWKTGRGLRRAKGFGDAAPPPRQPSPRRGRRGSILLPVTLAFAVVLVSCGPREPPIRPALDPAAFSGERAYAELERFLALGPRDAATPGAAAAANYLFERLRALGLSRVETDAFADECPRGEALFRNVIGRIPGEGEGLVILGSHYDTKSGIPDFQGANDSGSSTAALIELAGVLARGPKLPFETWVVFFDGEECMERYGPNDGLHGSRRMANALVQNGRAKSVKAMILLDMIGDRDLTVTIPRNTTPELASLVFQAAHAEGVRHMFSLYPYQIGDDHEPFLQAGMPAVNLIDFQYGSAPGRNDYWHTPGDAIDKISAESLDIVGRVVIRVLNKL